MKYIQIRCNTVSDQGSLVKDLVGQSQELDNNLFVISINMII